MIQIPTWRRLLGVFAAVLHLAVLGAGVADEGRASPVDSSHVESHGGDACEPPHAGDCAVCRVLSTGGLTEVPEHFDLGLDAPRGLFGSAAVFQLAAPAWRQPPTRAPPPV